MSRSMSSPVVVQVSHELSLKKGALRVIERIGSVAGPLLAACVLGQFGYAGSAASSGVIVIAGSVLLGLVLLALGDGRRTATARGLP